MLYSTILLATALPFACLWFYRQGINDGRAVKDNQPLQPIVQFTPKTQESPEDKRIDTILRNIDSYNGTGEGQADVR